MEPFTIAVLAVASERLVVVAAGLVAIVLGWNLFVRAIMPDQSGSVSVGDWKVELKAVGPGIFFSLFGTVILVYVLLKPAQYNINGDVAAGSSSSSRSMQALGVGAASDIVARSYIRAINTVELIETGVTAQPAGAPATLLDVQRNDLAKAAAVLAKSRREILVRKFGGTLVDAWEADGATYRTAPQTLSLDVRNKLAPVAPWFTETVTDEPTRQ